MLESDSEAYSYQDKDISSQSDTDSDRDTDEITDMSCTQWTDNTLPSVPAVHVFTGGSQWVTTDILLKTVPHLAFSCSIFSKIMQLLVEEIIRYYYRYLETLDKGQSSLPDVTVQEMQLL